MAPMVLLVILAAAIVVATALALAGRWQPQGLPPQPPAEPDHAAFDVVVRGYRMEQVDAEIARLRAMLAQQSAPRMEAEA